MDLTLAIGAFPVIRDMVFLNLWGLVNDRPEIIESLHDLGVLHLHDEPAEALKH